MIFNLSKKNNKPSYNELISFIVDYQDNEREEENKNNIKFYKNEYFSVAISKNNKWFIMY